MSGTGTLGNEADPARRLLRGGSTYTLATAAQLGAGLLVLPVLTRVLDAGEYGTVTAALVVFNLLSVSIGLGLATAISRSYFHRDDRSFGRDGTLGLVWASGLLAAAIALVLELTGPLWSELYEGVEYEAPLRLAVWTAVAYALLQSAQSLLRAEERPRPYVVAAIVATAGAQTLGLAGAVAWGVSGYMAGVAVGVAIAAALALHFVGAFRAPAIAPGLVRRNLAIGLPTVPHALALYVLAAGDRVVVERLEGLAAVARYHVAFLVGFVVILTSAALNNAWTPIVFGAEPKERWRMLAETTATVVRVTAIAAAAVAVLAPLALRVAAPGAYGADDLADVTVLVAVSALPYVLSLACVQLVLWRAVTWWLALITPAVGAFNIGLNFLLIPEYGLIGAAIATLVSYALLGSMLVAVCRRIQPVPWRWRSMALSAALVFAVATAALVAPGDGAWLIVRGLLGAGIVLVLAERVATAAQLRGRGADPAPV